jgi:hypothetical protein
MDTSLKKKDKGYHIRSFDPRARRLAKAGASVSGVDIGTWISQAVKEKFARDIAQRAHGVEDTPQAREV